MCGRPVAGRHLRATPTEQLNAANWQAPGAWHVAHQLNHFRFATASFVTQPADEQADARCPAPRAIKSAASARARRKLHCARQPRYSRLSGTWFAQGGTRCADERLKPSVVLVGQSRDRATVFHVHREKAALLRRVQVLVAPVQAERNEYGSLPAVWRLL